jgi:L-fucono-1,5-lactonase
MVIIAPKMGRHALRPSTKLKFSPFGLVVCRNWRIAMRIDGHQHFWIYNSSDYVWMTDAMEVLRQDYLPTDLAPLLDESGFQGTVAVQARQMQKETEWLLDLAAEYDFVRGVVGWVDFNSADLDEALERFAANSKLVGVRELIHDMPDSDYALSENHTRAIAKLEQFGLTYDLLLRPEHLQPACRLVQHFPNQLFVVDHLAKPAISRGELQPWSDGLRDLARCENVFCKLSGMVTEAVWKHWRQETFDLYLDVAVDAFGTERIMIGSDWPVCTLSGSYAETMAIVTDYAACFSETEQADIFGGNADRFYNLEPLPGETRAQLGQAGNH